MMIWEKIDAILDNIRLHLFNKIKIMKVINGAQGWKSYSRDA